MLLAPSARRTRRLRRVNTNHPFTARQPGHRRGVALSGVTTDQRGEPLDSPAPDIGAYQTQGFTITPVDGSTPQSVAAGDAFANPLAVTVRADEPNQPVAGGIVTYTANPASNGASAKLTSSTATIGADGTAQVDATANSPTGGYTVTASIATDVTASFSLTNQIQPAFTGLTDPSITFGTSSVTIEGTLADGPPVSSDESVGITARQHHARRHHRLGGYVFQHLRHGGTRCGGLALHNYL